MTEPRKTTQGTRRRRGLRPDAVRQRGAAGSTAACRSTTAAACCCRSTTAAARGPGSRGASRSHAGGASPCGGRGAGRAARRRPGRGRHQRRGDTLKERLSGPELLLGARSAAHLRGIVPAVRVPAGHERPVRGCGHRVGVAAGIHRARAHADPGIRALVQGGPGAAGRRSCRWAPSTPCCIRCATPRRTRAASIGCH